MSHSFRAYILKQQQKAKELAQELEAVNRREELATKKYNNSISMLCMSDNQLRIHNGYERITAINRIDGRRSLDPVYRKISEASYSPNHRITILDYVQDLQMKMEARQMTEAEYNQLNDASPERLLDMLLEGAETRYRRINKTEKVA